MSAAATRIEGDDFIWELDLPARGTWTCEIHVPLKLGPREIQPMHAGFGEVFAPEAEDPVDGLARPAAAARVRLVPARRGGRPDARATCSRCGSR